MVTFTRSLRGEGVSCGPDRTLAFCQAAALLPPGDLYWAGRTTLLAGPADIPVYDEVFVRFFGVPPRAPLSHRPRVRVHQEHDRTLASADEVLRHKSFSACTPEELVELRRLMEGLRYSIPSRRTRRRRPSRSGTPDMSRTLRRSFRTGGDPVKRMWRERSLRPRRLVLVLDVSGSMTAASRALLLFAHALTRTTTRCESFCFGTRLTRLTGPLSEGDAGAALERAAAEVVDWNGGTRIGDSLGQLLDRHGSSVRGSVVVVCSDGLDVGDPQLVATHMSRLSRLAYRVVWLNPLKEDPEYEPLAGGMRAALPHIDRFRSGHSLESLEALGDELTGL
jgi:uncharacterized protein with von Willebrand factor type A (vWA) domain